MARARVVQVTAEVVELRTGLWCTTCALPSGVAVTLALTWPSGATDLRQTYARCLDCSGDRVETA